MKLKRFMILRLPISPTSEDKTSRRVGWGSQYNWLILVLLLAWYQSVILARGEETQAWQTQAWAHEALRGYSPMLIRSTLRTFHHVHIIIYTKEIHPSIHPSIIIIIIDKSLVITFNLGSIWILTIVTQISEQKAKEVQFCLLSWTRLGRWSWIAYLLSVNVMPDKAQCQ